MHFINTLNSASICTGLKTNAPAVTTQGTVFLYYLIINSQRLSLTTRYYYQLGGNDFRCIGVYHDASMFYTLVENLTFLYMLSFPLVGGTINKIDLT